MWFIAVGGTNVAFLAIGGTYVDLIEGGTNVSGTNVGWTNVGRTNVGRTNVAASLFMAVELTLFDFNCRTNLSQTSHLFLKVIKNHDFSFVELR